LSTVQEYTYNYASGNNRLMKANGSNGTQSVSLSYDNNGNLLTDNVKGIVSTEYTRSTYPSDVVMTDKAVHYLYNANDQRIYKKIGSFGSKEYYLYDAMGRMIALKVENELTASSGLKWKYFVSGAERELSIIPNVLQQPGSNYMII
jgi:hypothetical protein